MSNADVKKNFSLSAAFTRYVVKNPDVLKGIPKKACIILTEKSDPVFSKKNVQMAEKEMRASKTSCYKAEKVGGTWRVMKLRLS